MAKSDDIQIALGALSIISEGLAQAHATDVQFRIAELQAKQDDARIASAEAQKSAEILFTLNREAKQEYKTSLDKVTTRYKGINAADLTSSGNALITDVFTNKKLDIEKLAESTQVYDDRRVAADKLYRDLQNQELELNQIQTMIDPISGQPFFGLSQYLNPDEFKRLQEYAMTADDPDTENIVEGLGWETKYPGMGTAGIDAAYRDLGSDAELRTLEMSVIDKKMSKLNLNLEADFTTLKAIFTTDEETDGQSLSEKSEAYGIPENIFSSLQTMLTLNSPESALQKVYSIGGAEGDQVRELLRTNPITYNLFNTMEANYDKIFKFKAEQEGLSLSDESASFKNTILSYKDSTDKTIDDVMYVMKKEFDNGIGFTEADEYMQFIADTYNMTIEEAQTAYSNIANLGSSNQSVNQILEKTVNPYDGPLALYESDKISNKVTFPGMTEGTETVAAYTTDNGDKIYIDVNKMYDILDQIQIHGDDFVIPEESIYWQFDEAHGVLEDQIDKFGDDAYYRIANDIFETGNYMYFNDTPSMNHKNLYGVNGWGNTPLGGYQNIEEFLIAEDSYSAELIKTYKAQGIDVNDPELYQSLITEAWNMTHGKGLLEGVHYDHSRLPGWSAANAFGIGAYDKWGESVYWDTYNDEMETQMDFLLDQNHIIKAGRGSQTMDEQRVPAMLQWYEIKYDAPGFYDNAHRIAEGKGKAAQIEFMIKMIEEDDDNAHKFKALLTSLDIIENANIDSGPDFIINANHNQNELNALRGLGKNEFEKQLNK